MSAMESARLTTSSDWGLVLLQGIAAVVLGLFLVTAPSAATVVVVAFIGAYWLVSGILSIVRIFTGGTRAHWAWALLVGIIGVAAGLLVLRHPLYSALLIPAVLVTILGFMGLFMGVLNLMRGLSGDGAGIAFIGVIDFILGLVLLGSPFVAAVYLPVVAGIFVIIGGVALIAGSFSLRDQKKEEVAAEARRAA